MQRYTGSPLEQHKKYFLFFQKTFFTDRLWIGLDLLPID